MPGLIRTSQASSSSHSNGPYVKRAQNAFMLYRNDRKVELSATLGNNQQTLSSVIGEMWKNESEDVIRMYERRAELEKLQHKVNNPSYKFTPGMKQVFKEQMKEQKRLARQQSQAGEVVVDFGVLNLNEPQTSSQALSAVPNGSGVLAEGETSGIFMYTTFSASGEQKSSLIPPGSSSAHDEHGRSSRSSLIPPDSSSPQPVSDDDGDLQQATESYGGIIVPHTAGRDCTPVSPLPENNLFPGIEQNFNQNFYSFPPIRNAMPVPPPADGNMIFSGNEQNFNESFYSFPPIQNPMPIPLPADGEQTPIPPLPEHNMFSGNEQNLNQSFYSFPPIQNSMLVPRQLGSNGPQ